MQNGPMCMCMYEEVLQATSEPLSEEGSLWTSGIPGNKPALDPLGIVASTGVKLPPLERRTFNERLFHLITTQTHVHVTGLLTLSFTNIFLLSKSGDGKGLPASSYRNIQYQVACVLNNTSVHTAYLAYRIVFKWLG